MRRLTEPDSDTRRALTRTYGDVASVLDDRLDLLLRTLCAFVARFGDQPVRVFRAPARINLRGMHVDTHGGYLNLMTHQRETVVVAGPMPEGTCTFTNIEPEFDEAGVSLAGAVREAAWGRPWADYITLPEVRALVDSRKGSWENYLRGAVLRAQYEAGCEPLCGVCACVGSDIPRGAALSSSHALATAILLGVLGLNGMAMGPEALILAVRDAEWYTGARTGTSDQGAMILGGRNELINATLHSEDLDLSGIRRMAFPDDVRVLVIHSHTRRNLSGAALADYTRNRFAYSLALYIFRRELRRRGHDAAFVESLDRLARITPERLGGPAAVYEALRGIPLEVDLGTLRMQCDPNEFDAAFSRYFGMMDAAERPRGVPLRGPLLFALAESDRARVFFDLLVRGDYVAAGRLMSIGHDGDRVVTREGRPFSREVGDSILDSWAAAAVPLAECPGDYGASSPALDALVDAALAGGALGASLTGAGIAGSVVALCRAEGADGVAARVRACLASANYARAAGLATPLSDDEADAAVVVNAAVAAAGELTL